VEANLLGQSELRLVQRTYVFADLSRVYYDKWRRATKVVVEPEFLGET
jgi:hypothetical protein